jgi:hypothetical protein
MTRSETKALDSFIADYNETQRGRAGLRSSSDACQLPGPFIMHVPIFIIITDSWMNKLKRQTVAGSL